MDSLDKLFEKHDAKKCGAEYVMTTEWSGVVAAARDFIAYTDS
jgi:hypothetical protein